jgi:hypothetical protein
MKGYDQIGVVNRQHESDAAAVHDANESGATVGIGVGADRIGANELSILFRKTIELHLVPGMTAEPHLLHHGRLGGRGRPGNSEPPPPNQKKVTGEGFPRRSSDSE